MHFVSLYVLHRRTRTFKVFHIMGFMNLKLYWTHWGRVMHICVSKLTINGSGNSLSPCWHQAIIWINAGILVIGHLGTHFIEILIKIYTSSFKKMHLKMSGKWQPFCQGLNVLSAVWFLAHKRHQISPIESLLWGYWGENVNKLQSAMRWLSARNT